MSTAVGGEEGEAAGVYETGQVLPLVLPLGRPSLGVASDASPHYDVGAHERVDPQEALDALEHTADLLAQADLGSLDDRGLLEHTVDPERQPTRVVSQRVHRLRRSTSGRPYLQDARVTTPSSAPTHRPELR